MSKLRRNRVVLLLTDQELRDVRKAAGKARASDWGREVILAAAQRRLRST